ncbi:MAG: hypothetical protein Q4C47_08950, partial [Planctomycetia bacterium]|nr:hypothetical protein [Planctomycetia bacterium]
METTGCGPVSNSGAGFPDSCAAVIPPISPTMVRTLSLRDFCPGTSGPGTSDPGGRVCPAGAVRLHRVRMF